MKNLQNSTDITSSLKNNIYAKNAQNYAKRPKTAQKMQKNFKTQHAKTKN